jgi:AcrR family transcriptional regulator
MTTIRRTQQQRRDHTRGALLGAAAELVVEYGVRAVTLARVGERAGYSRGIVSHHFGSKAALIAELAHSTQAGFVPGLGDLDPGLDRLLQLIDGYLGQLNRLGVLNRAFLVLWAESATEPELTPVFRERDDSFRSDLRDDVQAGIAAGQIDAAIDPAASAVAIVGQLRGIAFQKLLSPDIDVERLRHTVTDQWRRALQAV